jgi:hypothetical protein
MLPFVSGKCFLEYTSKTITHNKSDKLDFIKMSNFCFSKYIIKEIKIKTDYEKHVSEKELVFRIHKILQGNKVDNLTKT